MVNHINIISPGGLRSYRDLNRLNRGTNIDGRIAITKSWLWYIMRHCHIGQHNFKMYARALDQSIINLLVLK